MIPARRLSRLLSLVGASLAAACGTLEPTPAAGLSTRRFEGTVSYRVAYRYLLYLPEGYVRDSASRWPLLLFLHGSGERGDDLALVRRHGPPKLLAAGGELPFVVVAPQCPQGERWRADALAALLDDVTRRLRIDGDRVYVTGLSMGGRGTWDLAMSHPGRFAAIAPVCGGALPDRACNLKGVPIRAFHGAKDDVVPLSESERVVEAVRRCGGTAELVVFPEAGHDSWTSAYSDSSLWDWLLSHRRRAAK